MEMNISIFVGYKLKGVWGSVICALGTILPSFCIILLIAMFFNHFEDNPWVAKVFNGIRPAVVALIAVPCISAARSLHLKRVQLIAPAIGALLIWLCGVSPEAVQDEIKQLRRRKAASARRKDEREQLRPVRMSQPQAQGIRYENPRSAAAEQGVIRLLYIDPELFRNVELGEGDFSSKELWQIYSALRRHVDGGGKLSPAALSGELTAEEASLFTSLIQSPESAANGKRALADYIAIMREGPRNTASTPEELMELAGRMKKTKSYGG